MKPRKRWTSRASSKEYVTQRLGVTQDDGRRSMDSFSPLSPHQTVHYHCYLRILILLEKITSI